MDYRLIQTYYTRYPLTAKIYEIKQFACYYEIDYTFTGRNYLTVDVLENWPWEKRPIAISAAMMLPYDITKTAEENAKPDDRWYLIFQNNDQIKIGDWKMKTPQMQADFLGENYTPEKEGKPAFGSAPGTAADDGAKLLPNENLKSLFASVNGPNTSKNLLWVILVVVFSAIAFVIYWAIKKAKTKAEVVASKYGKYSKDMVDIVT
ncbi:hypothetical protein FHS57_005151 [Runella defluvii]|uniref:Uncharacterized protein n=1 Tax=Runella defluvii TaxID=370973 RepID=A0A7W5ZP94_9BACT|nr:hypothetical protein [Runella defluvii]MBB3841130.1 hypothetical protein [Runella defluvii]